jgi:hypothetical protein
MENKLISPQNQHYLNVPLSIIDQRWYCSDNAVRAWFFYAWHSIHERDTKVKGKVFHLSKGETICTRSYLAKSLGIKESGAKGSTDRLKRSDAIAVRQEAIPVDVEKAPKNRVSRVSVKGIPVPAEPYIKVILPLEEKLFWEVPALAQLYIYMMCSTYHKESYTIGTRGESVRLVAGDYILNYTEIKDALHCKEWQLKRHLRTFETCGAITRSKRIGNKGILIHLNYYPDKAVSQPGKVSTKASAEPVNKLNNSRCKVEATGKETPKKNIEVKATPVSDAVRYLFMDLKRNKDIDRLNRIIDYVNLNLPKNFPMDKLKEAVKGYYEQHRSEYIDEVKLAEYLSVYNNKYVQHKQSQKDNNYREQILKKRAAKERENVARFNRDWKVVDNVYKEYQKTGNVSLCPEDQIRSVYFTLWCSNNQGHYVENLNSHKVSVDKAQYVERFFSYIGSEIGLRSIYQSERQKLVNEYNKNMAAIQAEYKELTA